MECPKPTKRMYWESSFSGGMLLWFVGDHFRPPVTLCGDKSWNRNTIAIQKRILCFASKRYYREFRCAKKTKLSGRLSYASCREIVGNFVSKMSVEFSEDFQRNSGSEDRLSYRQIVRKMLTFLMCFGTLWLTILNKFSLTADSIILRANRLRVIICVLFVMLVYGRAQKGRW